MRSVVKHGKISGMARPPTSIRLSVEREAAGVQLLKLAGRLDSSSTGGIWRKAMDVTRGKGQGKLVVDASAVDYCDGAGASLLLALQHQQESAGAGFELRGLRSEFARLIEMIAPSKTDAATAPDVPASFLVTLGKSTLDVLAELRGLTAFVGEMVVWLGRCALRPTNIRFRDTVRVAESAGIGAIPIIVLVGFLLGLILSFQSVIPMQRFGAQVFVADFLGIAMLRELGPLMTAILLTARSGSAFAAELGTMKVNEEIDALTTMGLEPVRFLVIPRVLAAIVVVPVLTMVMNVAGLVGGLTIFLSMGFPLVTYVNRIIAATSMGDLLGGLAKSVVLGVIVAAVGCQRGLDAGKGASAVGDSTTSSVVTGIVLIAVVEGVFAVVFYVMGW
jgi:phospholipid/cholesterol/gamma-HCH transport system permease protein